MRNVSQRLARYEGALAGCRTTILSGGVSEELKDLGGLFAFIKTVLPPVIVGDLSVADLDGIEMTLDEALANYRETN